MGNTGGTDDHLLDSLQSKDPNLRNQSIDQHENQLQFDVSNRAKKNTTGTGGIRDFSSDVSVDPEDNIDRRVAGFS